MKKNLFLVFFLFFLHGCGGGGASTSGGGSSNLVNGTAYFYDSAVNGIEYYNCGTKSGVTGDSGGNGSFKYQSDCTVEFKIGKIHLGSVSANSLSNGTTIYPTTILGLPTSTIDDRVENMLILLQTLDSDNNVSNEITISSATRETLTNSLLIDDSAFVSNFNTTLSDLNNTINTLNSINGTNYVLVNKEEALLHFEETLKDIAGITVNLSNPKPYLVDKTGKQTTLTSIKTVNTLSKDIIIKGKTDTKIYKAFNTDGNSSNLSFIDTNKTIGSDRNGYLTLSFNDDNITHFHYFIKLIYSDNNESNESEILHLDIEKDLIPPHVNSSNLIDITLNEEEFLLEDINATDSGELIKYRVVECNITANCEDNRSTHWQDFNITDGKVSFIKQPSYENLITKTFQVVVRAIDYIGNMTDVLLKVTLKNILDNPPILFDKNLYSEKYSNDINESNTKNGDSVFDLSTLLNQEELDNNLSTIYYTLNNLNNGQDIFEINNTTGIITIKDETNPLFDYERRDINHSIILNVTLENNNTKYKDANDTTQTCSTTCNNTTDANITIHIKNVIDTAPVLIQPTVNKIIPEHSLSNFINDTIQIQLDEINSDFDTSNTKYYITAGDDNHHFKINQDTRLIEVNTSNPLDYESQKEYNLTIQAKNTWDDNTTHLSNSVVQTINIMNVVDRVPIIYLTTDSN
ncbi:MAG: cadherin domain-containing protein, partial [Arcobacteraceae bacterium]|nr:cadherin domain-containing protein [Arcobacteraceae bacterium]